MVAEIMTQAKRLPPFKDFLRAKIRTGEKTMTRRVMNPQPPKDADCPYHIDIGTVRAARKCPYGKPGDIRFLIEPLKNEDGFAFYQDDGIMVMHAPPSCRGHIPIPWRWSKPYLTSIHMPTVAARTFVRLTEIRVERVQDISEEDAIAEGIRKTTCGNNAYCYEWNQIEDGCDTAVEAFHCLWDSINGKRNYPWASNPYVWCISWEPTEKPQ